MSSFCESHGNRVYGKKKKITFSNCFIGYKEEVEEEEEDYYDDDYYIYVQCP
jgi:hypothetical protein